MSIILFTHFTKNITIFQYFFNILFVCYFFVTTAVNICVLTYGGPAPMALAFQHDPSIDIFCYVSYYLLNQFTVNKILLLLLLLRVPNQSLHFENFAIDVNNFILIC